MHVMGAANLGMTELPAQGWHGHDVVFPALSTRKGHWHVYPVSQVFFHSLTHLRGYSL